MIIKVIPIPINLYHKTNQIIPPVTLVVRYLGNLINCQNGQNVTVKVHILEAHVCDFFERKKDIEYEGKGLHFHL